MLLNWLSSLLAGLFESLNNKTHLLGRKMQFILHFKGRGYPSNMLVTVKAFIKHLWEKSLNKQFKIIFLRLGWSEAVLERHGRVTDLIYIIYNGL